MWRRKKTAPHSALPHSPWRRREGDGGCEAGKKAKGGSEVEGHGQFGNKFKKAPRKGDQCSVGAQGWGLSLICARDALRGGASVRD